MIVTHSVIFLDSNTIKSTYRFFKNDDNYTEFSKPQINQTDKDLMQIITYSNTSKLFSTKKVILVEGASDEIFYNFLIEQIKNNHKDVIIDLEIINISGKGNFEKWREFLDKFAISNYYIGDLDNILEKNFPFLDQNTKQSLKTEYLGKSETQLKLKKDSNYMRSKTYTKDFLNFVKSKNSIWLKIEKAIDAEYKNKIFILKEGELEDYLGISTKNMEDIIEFGNKQFSQWNTKSNQKRNEIFQIMSNILGKNIFES